MKITMVIGSLGTGGAERVLTMLANAWAARGWLVTIITLDKGEQGSFYPLAEGVQWIPAWSEIEESWQPLKRVGNTLRRVLLLRKIIAASNPQVILSFIDISNIFTILVTRGLKLPVIISERIHPAKHPLPRKWRILRRLVYPLADRLVIQFGDILSFYPRRMRNRIIAIPNPVNQPPPESGRALVLPQSKNLIAVGRLVDQKGFDLLLEAFGRLKEKYPDWGLILVGEGQQRTALIKSASRLGVSERLLLTGTARSLYDYYRAADLFVLSSRYEGFPNALCEAMSVGLSVVATRASGGVEMIVQDGINGLLTPVDDVGALADALATMMSDPQRRAQMGQSAQQVVDRFSLDTILMQWDNLFSELG
jgi:GalNAc-alpha-(1->4)-GalNAc-alpha-(1->3)-diNAcBac-PP-undecaprenol alpha-1,4-N-acetyl-D-galactosaminyltransferase